jgi:hypothetical protein
VQGIAMGRAKFRRPVSPRVVNPLRKVEFLRVHDLVDTVLGAVEDLHATQTPHLLVVQIHVTYVEHWRFVIPAKPRAILPGL